jgi:hypothetical protein
MAGLRSKLQKLRDFPKDLFAGINEVRDVVERQHKVVDHEIRSLNDQLPDVADSLVKILLQMRAWGLPYDEHGMPVSPNGPARPLADGTSMADSSQLPPWRRHDLQVLQEAVRGGMADAMDSRNARIFEQIQEMVQLQRDNSWLLPSHLWMPEVGERVRRTLSILRPFRVGNASKTRLGRANDGGYVMVDDFADVDCALSLGIDSDVSWDLAVAARGIKVVQFDHTVAGPPDDHAMFEFHRTQIAPDDTANTVSIQTLLRQRQAAGDRKIILKIDIEGDEWSTLADIDEADLRVCSQIICEFHTLNQLRDETFAEIAQRCFTRLSADFFVCHVHANNCGNVYNVGNVLVPESLEVTFASRAHYQPVDSVEIFPTPIDMPNQAGRADIFLGAFRFSV